MTNKSFLLLIISILSATNIFAQNKKEQDRQAVKSMCGCYEVKFNFAETFQNSPDSTYKESPDKHSAALEWVFPAEESEDKIALQHLLLVGPDNKPHIIKHWRQDWLYNNRELYVYEADNRWKFVRENEKPGSWTQKVYQVDDSPRYEGTAEWIHLDGKSYWENTTDAPLPRREYTQRSDYNVTVRQNRHEITASGWLHEQDNKKVVRKKGEKDFVLAEEKGYNIYTKTTDERCAAAKKWWEENADLWAKVRGEWAKVFAQNQDLELREKVDGKPLYRHLFNLKTDAGKKEIRKIFTAFLKN